MIFILVGGGCGNELAKWVVNGRPDLDMSGYDIRRFCPEVSKNKNWVIERSHEAYAKNYSMVFPHDEPLAGRNMKKVDSSENSQII
jgi:sarcosine dehydrogenase